MKINDSSLYSNQTALIQLKYLVNQQLKVYVFEDFAIKTWQYTVF